MIWCKRLQSDRLILPLNIMPLVYTSIAFYHLFTLHGSIGKYVTRSHTYVISDRAPLYLLIYEKSFFEEERTKMSDGAERSRSAPSIFRCGSGVVKKGENGLGGASWRAADAAAAAAAAPSLSPGGAAAAARMLNQGE